MVMILYIYQVYLIIIYLASLLLAIVQYNTIRQHSSSVSKLAIWRRPEPLTERARIGKPSRESLGCDLEVWEGFWTRNRRMKG